MGWSLNIASGTKSGELWPMQMSDSRGTKRSKGMPSSFSV
jgi:hypothetical protein